MKGTAIPWTVPGASGVLPFAVAGPPRDATRTAVAPSTSDAALSELNESALIEACLAGRTDAFDLIVARHRRSVYQLCYRFVGNHEDASDLSQEVFLRAYRGLRSFRGRSS